jgi:hypothetical protein
MSLLGPHDLAIHNIDQEIARLKDQPLALRPAKQISDLAAEKAKLISKLGDDSRTIVARPASQQKTLTVDGPVPESLKQVVDDGKKIFQSYVDPRLYPKIDGVHEYSGPRPRYFAGHLFLRGDSMPSDVAHEMAHGLERDYPEVLKATRAFLQKRAAGESPVPLQQLEPEGEYRPGEVAFKDRWAEGGGSAYAGKLYSKTGRIEDATGTEILTEGIERLHKNPALFFQNDPEYFNFVVDTLHNINGKLHLRTTP